MAEESTDKSQKTEEPTPKRLEESLRKGQVAQSREINHWFMILTGALLVLMVFPYTMSALKQTFRKFIEMPHAMPVDFAHLRETLGGLMTDVGLALLVPLILLVAAAATSNLVQHGLIFAPERLQPKLERISLISGFKRMFSMKSVAEFVKGILKIAVVASVAMMLMIPEFDGIERVITYATSDTLSLVHGLIVRLLIGVVSVVTVIAAIDFAYQRFEHMKNMRMSRQEIKDEMKQTEGDPIVRQRLRQIRQERARQRMMAEVPDASVVVTNPTHYAVALKYELNVMHAPVLVAKGMDSMALRIREVAEENRVPIIENPPVARALYAGVELDEEVPEEHYKAVAEIITYVLKLKGELPQ